MMDNSQDCYEVLAHHGRTFHLASRFLPRERRADAAVLYAFCRCVDDIADETPDKEQALRELLDVQNELRGDRKARPIVKLFLEVAERRDIEIEAADCLIKAIMTDLGVVRLVDDGGLLRYCYGVAGTVGLMMCGALGVTSRQARCFAIDLGVGMQLTNICRDILEDAGRDRCYIPQTRLERNGMTQQQLIAGQCDASTLSLVTSDILQLAEQYYDSADLGMQAIPFPGRAAILVAARVYRSIGWRLQRVHGSNALHGRTIVPTINRIWWAALALIELLKPLFWLTRVRVHESHLHRALRGLPGTSVLLETNTNLGS